MLLASILVMSSFAGCAKTSKVVIHPLEDDFQLVNAGETVTAKKKGALVSDFWLSETAGVIAE